MAGFGAKAARGVERNCQSLCEARVRSRRGTRHGRYARSENTVRRECAPSPDRRRGLKLHRLAGEKPGRPILYIANGTNRAESLTALLKLFGGDLSAALFPRWDGSVADGIPPSAEAMGRRMSVLRLVPRPRKPPRIIVAQRRRRLRRVPPRAIWKSVHLELRSGDEIEPEDVQRRLEALGYVFDERVDDPGEAILRGLVIEVFPAAAPLPCRIELKEGRIASSAPMIRRRSARSMTRTI